MTFFLQWKWNIKNIYILSVFVHAIVSGKQNGLVTNMILSKYLLLCSADEENHTGLERHEGE